jgi:hypothetical protein
MAQPRREEGQSADGEGDARRHPHQQTGELLILERRETA